MNAGGAYTAKDKTKTKLEKAEEVATALAMRRARASYRQIGDHVGVSAKTAMKWVHEQLTRLAEETTQATEIVRALDADTINGLLSVWYPRAVGYRLKDGTLIEADAKAALVCTRLLTLHARLYGLIGGDVTVVNDNRKQVWQANFAGPPLSASDYVPAITDMAPASLDVSTLAHEMNGHAEHEYALPAWLPKNGNKKNGGS